MPAALIAEKQKFANGEYVDEYVTELNRLYAV